MTDGEPGVTVPADVGGVVADGVVGGVQVGVPAVVVGVVGADGEQLGHGPTGRGDHCPVGAAGL